MSLQGNFEAGNSLAQESLKLYRDLKDTRGQANALNLLGFNNNDMERSKSFARDALRLYRELGDLSSVAGYLACLAQRTISEGDFSSNITGWLEEARMIYDQLGHKSGKADMFDLLGRIAFWRGNYEQARIFFEESMALFEQTGSLFNESWSRINLAYTILRQGDIIQAKERFGFSIQQFHKVNNMIGMVYTIEGLASLNVNQNQPERATQFFAWADTMREKIGDVRPPLEQASVEKDLAVIHSKVNDTEYTRLCVEGRTMTVEQAIALALEE
jgi:tetratricopeptide (TPR) repeat protein